MNVAMVTVLLVIALFYVVGSLTSSVKTEQELPHRF